VAIERALQDARYNKSKAGKTARAHWQAALRPPAPTRPRVARHGAGIVGRRIQDARRCGAGRSGRDRRQGIQLRCSAAGGISGPRRPRRACHGDDDEVTRLAADPWLNAFPPMRCLLFAHRYRRDSAGQSFAGVHETRLNVDRAQLAEAVLACRRSAGSPRALEYRRARGLSRDAIGIACSSSAWFRRWPPASRSR